MSSLPRSLSALLLLISCCFLTQLTAQKRLPYNPEYSLKGATGITILDCDVLVETEFWQALERSLYTRELFAKIKADYGVVMDDLRLAQRSSRWRLTPRGSEVDETFLLKGYRDFVLPPLRWSKMALGSHGTKIAVGGKPAVLRGGILYVPLEGKRFLAGEESAVRDTLSGAMITGELDAGVLELIGSKTYLALITGTVYRPDGPLEVPVPAAWIDPSDRPVLAMLGLTQESEGQDLILINRWRFESGKAGVERFQAGLKGAARKYFSGDGFDYFLKLCEKAEFSVEGRDLRIRLNLDDGKELANEILRVLPVLAARTVKREAEANRMLEQELIDAEQDEVNAEQLKPTCSEADRFAMDLIDALEKRYAKRTAELVDYTAIVKRASMVIDSRTGRRDYVAKVEKTLDGSSMGLFTALSKDLEAGGSLSYLRSREEGGHVHVILRHSSAQGGFNYYEFKITKSLKEAVRATDFLSYAKGRWISTILSQANIDSSRRLASNDRKRRIARMQKHIDAGSSKAALKTFYGMSAIQRTHFDSLMTRLKAAAMSEDEGEYQKALDDLKKHCRHPGASWVLTIDSDLLRGQFAHVASSLEYLDVYLGGDPFLDSLRGNVWLSNGDHDKAEEAFLLSLKRDPNLEQGHDGLIMLALAQADHAGMCRRIDTMEKTLGFEIDPEVWREDSDFDAFFASDACKAWLALRK